MQGSTCYVGTMSFINSTLFLQSLVSRLRVDVNKILLEIVSKGRQSSGNLQLT